MLGTIACGTGDPARFRQPLIDLGIAPEKIVALRNGVDLDTFRPPVDVGARAALRERYGLSRFTLASVGHLIERKGHHLVIAALAHFPDIQLLIAGEGPEGPALKDLATRLGVSDRVQFLGLMPHARLCEVYGAADALVLASSREGWANVLLEAMACGTPVVATPVWGAPELVRTAEAGVLSSERSADAIASAIGALRKHLPERDSTRRYAERFGWQETTDGQLRLFEQILSGARRDR